MSFLNLLMVALGVLFLSPSAYGYSMDDWERALDCSRRKTKEACQLQGIDLSDLGANGEHVDLILENPNLEGANLNGVVFGAGVAIVGGSMKGVKCADAQFNNSTWINVDFRDADCPRATFYGTGLWEEEGGSFDFAGANFEGGFYNEYTWLPEGFIPEDHGLSFSDVIIH